jgi:hypothetical protein
MLFQDLFALLAYRLKDTSSLALSNFVLNIFLHIADLGFRFVKARQVSLQEAKDGFVAHIEIGEEVLDPEEHAHKRPVDFCTVLANETNQFVNERLEVVQVFL